MALALAFVFVCLFVCLSPIAKTALKDSNHFLLELWPPLNLIFYLEKCFLKIEKAATTAVTAVTAVNYIKTVKNGSNPIISEFWPPLKLSSHFQNCFQKFITAGKTAATAVW